MAVRKKRSSGQILAVLFGNEERNIDSVWTPGGENTDRHQLSDWFSDSEIGFISKQNNEDNQYRYLITAKEGVGIVSLESYPYTGLVPIAVLDMTPAELITVLETRGTDGILMSPAFRRSAYSNSQKNRVSVFSTPQIASVFGIQMSVIRMEKRGDDLSRLIDDICHLLAGMGIHVEMTNETEGKLDADVKFERFIYLTLTFLIGTLVSRHSDSPKADILFFVRDGKLVFRLTAALSVEEKENSRELSRILKIAQKLDFPLSIGQSADEELVLEYEPPLSKSR